MPNIWVAVPSGGDATQLVRNTLTMSNADTIDAQMDFGDMPELIAGAIVSNCSVAISGGPSVTTPGSVNSAGYAVQTKLVGGNCAVGTYSVTFTAALNDSVTVYSRTGTLQVVG